MCDIRNTTRSDSCCQTSGQTGSLAEAFGGQTNYQDLINRANQVKLIDIFKYYKLFINEENQKVACPFPSHKGGRETTASFKFYPASNTFWCFGCKIGTNPCAFVSSFEKISRAKAAIKILSIFEPDQEEYVQVSENYSEKLQKMVDLSNLIRDFKQSHFHDKDRDFIDKLCKFYDAMNFKYAMSAESICALIDKLSIKINSY